MNYIEEMRSILEPLLEGCDSVALFDFPKHDNVGDLAIWLGEVQLIERVLGKRVIAVEHGQAQHLPELDSDIPVLLHGGGNLGDIWPLHEVFRQSVITRYPANRIILLPQSILFSTREKLAESALMTTIHPDLHICVRDLDSVTDASVMTPAERVYLCPDMALTLGPIERKVYPTSDILILQRSDKESANFGAMPEGVESCDWIGTEPTFLYRLADALDNSYARYPNRLAFLLPLRAWLYKRLAQEHLVRGCNLLSKGKVVVTDRLHAHILCSLLGIPHIVLDNSYGKIDRFRKTWKTGEGLCDTAVSWDEAITKARAMLHS